MFRFGFLAASLALGLAATPAAAVNAAPSDPPAAADFAVGPQYDSTHVYVDPADFDRFVASFQATFGGTTSKKAAVQVTPTASKTFSQMLLTPVGVLSVFGFTTPIPYPFGAERTGYLVTDIDAAVAAARRDDATVLVETFPDPIGRDAVVQWPGGVNMQFYWHTTAPRYPAPASVAENRVYLTAGAADAFVARWLAFSHGRVETDVGAAPGVEIGRPGERYRRVRIVSGYGRLTVLASDGALPWPYGRELTGYAVDDLDATLAKARAAGAEVLVAPFAADGRRAAMLRFPGGYIAEVHAPVAP